MAEDRDVFEYVVVGGGTAGCVVASRLSESLSGAEKVALIEIGEDKRDSPHVTDPLQARELLQGTTAFTEKSVPQPQLGGASVHTFGGRTLGGSSAVNYCAWMRGHASSYDSWAELVGDKRWSYQGLLPYFKRSEAYPDSSQTGPRDEGAHGFDGPVKLTPLKTGTFALGDLIQKAFAETGFGVCDDINGGDPQGLLTGPMSYHNGVRQHSANTYDLSKVKIFTDSAAHKILFKEGTKTATGVQLVNGSKIFARREVIVSCGAFRTPQVLLLSGIGPSSELQKHNIQQVADLPVGRALHDHYGFDLIWKLKHPERGLAVGSPAFQNPEGRVPADWIFQAAAPDADVAGAAQVDGAPFKGGPRVDYEISLLYMPSLTGAAHPVPMDGSHISTGLVVMSTTSRGVVSLASSNPNDAPVYDPRFYTTEHDKAVTRAAIRNIVKTFLDTSAGREFIEREVPAPGDTALTVSSTDTELDARINHYTGSHYHSAGTAAMGSVVDTECRVKGVENLRVVDASIMPVSITAHIQAGVYALAERAAALIVGKD